MERVFNGRSNSGICASDVNVSVAERWMHRFRMLNRCTSPIEIPSTHQQREKEEGEEDEEEEEEEERQFGK